MEPVQFTAVHGNAEQAANQRIADLRGDLNVELLLHIQEFSARGQTASMREFGLPSGEKFIVGQQSALQFVALILYVCFHLVHPSNGRLPVSGDLGRFLDVQGKIVAMRPETLLQTAQGFFR